MDSVYLRRLFPHDITHEVSITGRIVNNFFEQKVRDLSFFKEDIPHRFSVDINSATDPRFGGQFKMMYANDMADVNDILLILKKAKQYHLYVIKSTDGCYPEFRDFFDSRRHVIITLETDDAPTDRFALLSTLNQQICTVNIEGVF